MSDERSRACRAFLDRNADHVVRLARTYARVDGVPDEVTDILQDSVEALLEQWERSTPAVRPARPPGGRCATAGPGCTGTADHAIALTRVRVATCRACLVESADDLRRGYLNGILRHQAQRAGERRRRTRPGRLADAREDAARAPARGTDVEREVIGRWLGEELRTALDGLPARERAVLLLRFVEELDLRATAERLRMSVPAVKMAQHRGAARLRSLLPAEVLTPFERAAPAPDAPQGPLVPPPRPGATTPNTPTTERNSS